MSNKVVPYPGLRPFGEKDRAIFFGREAQMVSVLSLLEEQQFVGVVGSSGSGKSSLILAGVIPAVREGFLRGTSEWKIVTLKPGSDPCGNLARALKREGIGHEQDDSRPKSAMRVDPATLPLAEDGAKTLVEKLHATDRSLIDLVTPPSESAPIARAGSKERGELSPFPAVIVAPPKELSGPRMLIVVDQFEELFSFRRVEAETGSTTERFATRDEAATFVRLLLCACAETRGRIAVIITMRSDFIGDCDAFLELPELVSRCQFLVPRLNRSQMREAIERPGQIDDLGYAPFGFEDGLVNRIIADAGDRLDQLPLMQHALMRTWKEAGGPEASLGNSLTLTDQHYEKAGRITGALSRHADLAWFSIKEDKIKAQLTRQLFLLLCDVHPDGKIVRRRPLLAEVQAVTGAEIPAVEEIVRLFQSDDRNFLLPPLEEDVHLKEGDHLDISHEALLRQWTEFGKWLVDEAEWKVWLQELSQAAKDYEKDPETELWHGNDLRGAEDWITQAHPSETWARRHGVRNWEDCLDFLDRSRSEAARIEEGERRRIEEEEMEARRAREEKERYQKKILRISRVLGVVFLLFGGAMLYLYLQAQKSENRAKDAINLFAKTADDVAPPITAYATSALSEVEQQVAKLTAALDKAGAEPPPDEAALAELDGARDDAETAADAIKKLAESLEKAVDITKDNDLQTKGAALTARAGNVRDRLRELDRNADTQAIIRKAVTTRLDRTEQALAGLIGVEPLNPTIVKNRDSDILAATAHFNAINEIMTASVVLGLNPYNDADSQRRINAIGHTLLAANYAAQEAATTTGSIVIWKPENALASLTFGGRVNRVRFAPGFPADAPLLAAACQDNKVWFWQKGGDPRGLVAATHAINDLAFSPRGDALAAASDGSTVRILRWPEAGTLQGFDRANLKIQAFERHSDSITDVAFSHGGERIVSASADRTVRVFDSRSLTQLYFTSPPLPDIVSSVAFHPKDNLVVSGCGDGGVRLHTIDYPAVQLLGKFRLGALWPEFSPDGQLVVAASPDQTARVWPISQPREIVRVNHPAIVYQATFRPVIDGNVYTFVTTAANGEVRLVQFTDITSESPNHPAKILEPRHTGAAASATWSSDGAWLATVGGGEVIVWKWVNDTPVARLRMVDLHPATARAEFSPDARLLVTYVGDKIAVVWDLTKLHDAAP